MTVSILIPVYGVEKYIEECAISLFSQTYEDIKFVFCDDCTTDKSIEILQDVIERFPMRKNSVQIVKNCRNLGLGGTRAELFKHLHTESFMCVDSDDVLPIDAVEKLVLKMENSCADVVSGSYGRYFGGQVSQVIRPKQCSDRRFRKLFFSKLSNETHVWGKLYKTSLLVKTGPVSFEGINMAEDLCATSIISSVAHREVVDDIVYYYRVEGNSTFNKQNCDIKFLSYLKANRKILEYFQEKNAVTIPIELGMLHCYRFASQQGFDRGQINTILRFTPQYGITKLLFLLLQSKYTLPFNIGLLLFIIYRRIIIILPLFRTNA